MGKQRVQTRVEPDTKSRIEEYAEDRDIGDAETLRRLIRAGLAAEGYSVTAADGGSPLERLGSMKTVFFGAGLLLLATAALSGALVTSFTLPLAAVGSLLVLLGTLTVWAAALAQIALARPLRGLLGLGSEVSADD